MNCLDCRRLLLTQPQTRTEELAGHLRACSHCARWAAEQARFEQRLNDALRLPVADNLHDRVRLEASLRGRRPWRRRLWMAAVVAALSVSLGLSLGGWEYHASQSLTGEMADRMQARPALHSPSAKAFTNPHLALLTKKLGRYLASTQQIRIVSARQNIVDGQPAAYLRIAHGNARARIFLLPHARLALEHDVMANGIPGRLIPTDDGVIAVFCPDRQMLARVAKDLRSAPLWRG